jgi:hypothetical protein
LCRSATPPVGSQGVDAPSVVGAEVQGVWAAREQAVVEHGAATRATLRDLEPDTVIVNDHVDDDSLRNQPINDPDD